MYKVVHLTSVHHSFDTRIFYKECKTLALFGYEVVLVAQHDNNKNIDDIEIRALRKPKNRIERMTRIIWQVYQIANRENATVYHFHDPELIIVGLILKVQRKKVIYDVHEDVPRDILSKTWIAEPLRKIVAWLLEKLENFAAQQYDALATATPFISNRFLQLGCNAININNYPILKELHWPNLDWAQKERAICYVGGIGQIRGIFEMVEAIGQTDVRLLLAGRFADISQYNQAVTMPGWSQVQELGQLNRIEVARTLQRVMAGLVILHPTPCYPDSLPVKMFEYMSAGIPVIASNFPLWQEIVEGNDCGICVDPLNPTLIAEAIQWIVEHPSEAKRMGDNGRKAVENKYNWEKESEILIKLYGDLL